MLYRPPDIRKRTPLSHELARVLCFRLTESPHAVVFYSSVSRSVLWNVTYWKPYVTCWSRQPSCIFLRTPDKLNKYIITVKRIRLYLIPTWMLDYLVYLYMADIAVHRCLRSLFPMNMCNLYWSFQQTGWGGVSKPLKWFQHVTESEQIVRLHWIYLSGVRLDSCIYKARMYHSTV